MAFNPGGISASASSIGEPTKKSHVLLYAIIGIVIVAIGVGIYLYLKSRKTTTTGTTGHGTSGTSGNTGHSGTTGTTGTTGATGGSTGPCVAPGITMNALASPWFTYTAVSVNSTSTLATLTFDTSNIPAANFPLFLMAESYVVGYGEFYPSIPNCWASVPFPSGGIRVTTPLFQLAITHNTSYLTDPTLNYLNPGATGCGFASLASCTTASWGLVILNAYLVGPCGNVGPTGDVYVESVFGEGGICAGASSLLNIASPVTLP